MLKKIVHQSGTSTLRLVCGLVLILVGLSLAFVSYAANPPGGNVATTGPVPPFTGSWIGTAGTGAPTGGGESSCTEGVNCDSFALTIDGSPADWEAAGKRVHVQINWALPASDYDLFVHQGTLSGPVIAESAAGGTTQEQVDLDPTNSNIGTGLFTVHVVYFAATSADQYNGSVSVVATGAKPIPAPQATGFAPRFENYNPPAAGPATLGLRSGEPSIGVGAPITGHPEGRAMFQSDVQTLRVTFNGCSFPRSLWENKPATTSVQDFDPILWSDPGTGRTVVHLLTFAANVLVGESSFTDDDGDLYIPSNGTGIVSGIDHQTVGGGPYNETSTPPPPPIGARVYPNAVYYCSQALVDASCARSDDGGLNYGPSFITYRDECGGLHGHVKVGADGWAYLPNKGCGGEQAAVVSGDNGVTWQIKPIPGSTSAGSDPSVAVDASSRVYFGYADGDTKAVVTTSTDHGDNWSQPLDVGASFGIQNVAYPAFIAGDAGRAAMAFFGTPTAGGLTGNDFRGVWHLYIATTLDGGATWSTVDATPNDAIQRGCIWQGGGANVCRNLLDFFDVTIDHEGRILVGYDDGCAGAECAQAPQSAVGNSYTALAAIARQSGGPRLLAAFDGAAGTGLNVPGTPSVTALRNGPLVKVAWSEADNGGSAITGYNIYRGTASNVETLFASVPGTQLTFSDATATDSSKTYYYKVEAVNTQGISCRENEVSVRYVGDSHAGTGFTVAMDPTGDQTGAPANADLDNQSLSILEPGSGPNAGLIVFNLKVADLSAIPDQRMWRIVWNDPRSPGQQYYVGMTNDSTNGGITYEYGTVATATVGLVLGVPSTTKLGTPDSGSYDPSGLITIAVSKDKIGNVQIGDILGAFSARNYANVGNEIRSTSAIDTTSNATANDLTANSPTYAVVGPVPQLISAVSRKIHGSAGTFDVPLATAGTVSVEDRSGGSSGAHQVVFTFAGNIAAVSSATVTPGLNGTASISSTTINANQVTVNLTNVSNAQTVVINLFGVDDGASVGDISVPMAVLFGDVDSSRRTDNSDALAVRRLSVSVPTISTFRNDVDVSGRIDNSDALATRRATVTVLP